MARVSIQNRLNSSTQTASVVHATPDGCSDLSQALFLTGPRGGVRDTVRDPQLMMLLQGTTAARIIVYDPEHPERVVLRPGETGLLGPMGGDLRHEDANAVACAIRETREESRVAKFPDLNFVARLDHETRGAWVDLKKWEAWGYSTSGYQKRKGEIFIARVRTAIFCAPLSEGFRGRTVEGRSISLVDLSVPKAFEAIRPKFRHLLELWKERAQGRGQIPTVIRYTA